MGILSSVSNILSGGKNDEASRLSAAATAELKNVSLPDIEKMKIELQDLVSQGQLSPEEAQSFLQEKSQLNGISTDPKLQQAQMDALSSLQDISSNGGFNASDRANLSRIGTEEATQARGAREAILQNAQSRGMGGSGAELLAQLQNAQDSTTRQSQRDLDVAGMGQQRALDSLIQAGQMSGQMQNQSFNQQAQVANSNDAINRFNTQARQNTADQNVQARNAAQAVNLGEKQRIADTNIGTKNQQEQANKGLQQQQFDNQVKKASGIASGLQGQGQNATAQGQGIQNLIGTGLTAAAIFSDENCKENFEEFDAGKFLDSLSDKTYNYKGSLDDGKSHAGVMAQDLEKTEAGRGMVKETSQGKAVDYGQGLSTMMASMVELNERLKRLEGKKS